MKDPFWRVGLELELLAPEGLSRSLVARHFAKRIGGTLEYGFKYHTEGERTSDGKVICHLSDAVRVRDDRGDVLVTLVPDVTIRDGLAPEPKGELMIADDVRLALWVEDHCWSSDPHPMSRLEVLRQTFNGFEVEGGLRDKYGHVLIAPALEPMSFRRVCEFVTRPLLRTERKKVIGAIVQCAKELELTIPKTAALHAHYDAAPWQNVAVLKRFILESDKKFEAWRRVLRPNPNCLKLGRQAKGLLRVARDFQGDAFFPFGASLHLAGAHKSCDFNLQGVIKRFSKQPTLEVRCLPMSLEVRAIVKSLDDAEGLLAPFVKPQRATKRH